MKNMGNMGNRLRCLVSEIPSSVVTTPKSDIVRWVLVTPPNIDIKTNDSYAYLEFAQGRELEVLAWLHETSVMLRKDYARNCREQQNLTFATIENGKQEFTNG